MAARVPLLIASVATIGATVYLVVTLSGRGRPTPVIAPPPEPPTTAIELGDLELDSMPTEETKNELINAARDRAMEKMSESNIPSAAKQNLADAFRERLQSVIDPDYTRDRAARIARGQPPITDKIEPDGWRNQFAVFELSGFDTARLEVRQIFNDGEWIAPNPYQDEGFGTSTSQLSGEIAYPVPSDPEAAKLDVWEVRMPMEVHGPFEDQPNVALVGFRFVWHNDRQQWIPYGNTMYKPQGTTYFALPN